MSLINQALRKAQQDRSPRNSSESGPDQPGGGMPTASRKNVQMGVVIGLIALVVLLIGLVAGLSVVLLKGDSNEPAAVASAGAETPAAPAPPPPQPTSETPPAPSNPISTTDKGSPEAPAPNEPTASETPPAPMDELRPAREAAEAKIQADASAAAAAEAQMPAIVEWLSQSRINGVRISSTNSKIILNGEAYAEGEYVNFELGLKVIRIEETRVLFADDYGKKYKKQI